MRGPLQINIGTMFKEELYRCYICSVGRNL